MSALRVSPAQWLAVATFLVLAILASTQLRSIWRGEQQRQWPEWFARSLPACVVGGWLMIATLPMELFVMSRPEPVNPWIVLMLLAALLVVAAAIVVAVAVMLTGHPRWAVPPYLRGDHKGVGRT
jgi:hypothetical protein